MLLHRIKRHMRTKSPCCYWRMPYCGVPLYFSLIYHVIRLFVFSNRDSMRDLSSFRYHGAISREDADSLLSKCDGCYLVRESQRAQGAYTLGIRLVSSPQSSRCKTGRPLTDRLGRQGHPTNTKRALVTTVGAPAGK